jgi:hypothetical protein
MLSLFKQFAQRTDNIQLIGSTLRPTVISMRWWMVSELEYRPPHYREGELATLWRVIYDATRDEVFRRDEERAAFIEKEARRKGRGDPRQKSS